MWKITQCLTHVKIIYAQSDNTKYCKKGNLIKGLHVVSKSHGIKLLSLFYIGIQDGKGSNEKNFKYL